MKNLSIAVLSTLLLLAALTAHAQTLPDYLPADGLVAWYPFNGNADDESGNGLFAEVQGSHLWVDGVSDQAVFVIGNSELVSSSGGHVVLPDFSTHIENSLTVSFWCNVDEIMRYNCGDGGERLFAIGNGTEMELHIGTATECEDFLRFRLGPSTDMMAVSFNDFIGFNEWKHISYTIAPDGTSNGYVDGQLVVSSAFNSEYIQVLDFNESYLGRHNFYGNTSTRLKGSFDDLAIYNRALTPEEITALYTGEPVVTDCQDPEACNFEAVDEECVYPEPNLDCAGNCLNDENNNGVCDELECFEEVTIDVVLGESVTLTAFDPFQSSTLIWSNQMTFSGPSSLTTPLLSEGVSYRLEVNGFYDVTSSAYGLKDAAWYFCYFGCGCDCNSNNPAPVNLMNGEIIPVELRPTPDIYNPNHFYEYFLQGDGNVMNFSFTDGAYADNSGLLSFSLFELSSSDFTWSNGALGPSITITPTESMSYEVAIAGDLGEFCTGVYFVNVLNPGCTDEVACNYDIDAEVDNQTCVYPAPNLDCAGNCLNDADGDGVCDEFEILGCTDTIACNYMVEATDDDASCTYPSEPYLDCDGNCLNDANNNGICDELDVPGCTFEGACNFNPEATVNDNSCFFATAVYDCQGNCQQDSDGDGICDQNEGQNGSAFCGPNTLWDPVLQQCIGVDDCPGDLDNNGEINSNDLLFFLTAYGNACN